MRDIRSAANDGAQDGWLDGRVAGWALYDVASSCYVAIVPLLFPLLYAGVVLGGAPGGDARFAALGAVALVVAGVVTPVVGALADRGHLLRWLAGATLACCAAGAFMPGLGAGDAWLAGAAFIVAQGGYTVAMALYESYLPRIAPARRVALVSSFGWAMGLSGGILALVVTLSLVPGRAEAEGIAVAVVVAVAGYALLAVPALWVLHRRMPPDLRPAGTAGGALRAALAALADDLRGWRRHRNGARFLLAYLLINDTSVTITLVITLFFRETFGTSLEGIVKLVLLYHAIALPATLAWGRVADRIGLARAIHANLVLWAIGILLMIHARGEHAPWLIVCTFALVIASTNALCRALYARLVPAGRSAQFFGFNAVVGRMSAAIGPAVYAAVTAVTGSATAGLYLLIGFLALGAVVLATVDTAPVATGPLDAGEASR